MRGTKKEKKREVHSCVSTEVVGGMMVMWGRKKKE